MKHENVQQLFDRMAESTPDNVAISCGDTRITYRDVQRRTARLAHLLRSGGAKKDSIVAILLDDKVDAIVSIIAVLKAGAVFVPFDPLLPDLRLETMVREVTPDLFISEANLIQRLNGFAHGKVLNLDKYRRLDQLAVVELLTSPKAAPSAPDDFCYIYFTSGSTGRPKSIAGRLKGIDHFIRWQIETLSIGRKDRVSQLLPLSFDGSLRDIFVPLCAGGTICVPERNEIVSDARELVSWLDRESISLIHCVPTLFRAILNEDLHADQFNALRYVLLAGEALLPSDIGRWRAIFGDRVKLINLYGTSETTMAKFIYEVQPGDEKRRSVPVGKPMPGARALILDEDGRACPPGAIGEIYIRTPYRSHGYYKQPELTAEVFIPNPFNSDPNDIVYKTGDLGRMLEDGNIELLGRRDQQVKIRGVRVELEEINNLLRSLAGVRDVAVVDRKDANGGNYLCAYLVGDGELKVNELREHLQERLPNYMVPSAFVMMEKLPRTISGKLDRRALPSPAELLAANKKESSDPPTAVEEVVAGIWCKVLGLSQVGIHDNFFEVGGHSLLATQVLARVRDVFHVEVALRQLFDTPTVAGLAACVESAMRAGEEMPAVPIKRLSGETQLPLSYAQQRLWFIDEMGIQKAAYNQPGVLCLRGTLNVTALEQTVAEIIRRHETLRTVFRLNDGQPAQVVAPHVQFKLPVVDLSRLDSDERYRQAERLATQEAQHPFDLSVGPLLRVCLLRCGEQEHQLLFVMHHIISDAWSTGVLIRETGELYKAYVAGQPSGLPELPVQYADYAQWQREWMSGEVLEKALGYWKQQLAGAPALLELPTDRPRALVQSARGATVDFVIDREVMTALKRLGRQEGATLFMLLLAAFNILFHRYTRQTDIVVGTPIANRTRSETNDLIGFLVNTLVLRTDMSGDPTFRGLLRRVREIAFGAYAHQHLPFERLVEELQPERNLSHTPLFQVILVLHNAPTGTLELPDLELKLLEVESGTAKFDLTVNMHEVDGGLSVSFTYSTDLFDASTMQRLGQHFQALLASIAVDAGKRISKLNFLTEAEQRRLLVEANATERSYPADKTIHELFEEQVRRSPEATALVTEETEVTYAELLTRADLLASHLHQRGIGPGSYVGIFLEHSIETMVALLGVLRSGAAYVPMDPEHPRGRLAYIIEDARVAAILTQQSLAGRLPAIDGVDVFSLDQDWQENVAGAPTRIRAVTSAEPAYLIYTSGSTGQPKGVRVSHRALVNYLSWCKDVYVKGDEALFALYSSLAFDLTVTSLFTPLITGNSIVIYGSSDQFPVQRVVQDKRVDVLKLTPSHLGLIKDLDNRNSRVKRLIVGGESLTTELASQVTASFGGNVEIVNEYGPTEATVGCMIYNFDAERDQRQLVPIGRPAANVQIYILDEHLNPTPESVVGELYISGDGLADGYINRPDLTAEKFLPHPFVAGARMYRSGDRARWLPNGEIEYLGRGDEQIKYHGYRIELNEIRSALNRHPQVRDSVVLLKKDHRGEDILVAYYVARRELEIGLLREFLLDHLLKETIPNVFIHLTRLPLTLNGKVDYRALPELKQRAAGGEYVPPRTAVEEVVADIWANLLGVPRVSLHDNFFELGGHSLLATQVMVRVRRTTGVELPMRTLFEDPTVAKLAAQIDASLQSGQTSSLPPLLSIPRTEDLPLSFAQQRLWFLDQLEPGSAVYNCPAAVRFTGALNIAALEQSFNEVVRRHEVLRTSFINRDGDPVQLIAGSLHVPLPVIDLGGLPAGRVAAEVERLALLEAQRAFDLSRGPLLRTQLLQVNASEHVALLTMHHIISDGWSIGVLVKEVAALYTAYAVGAQSVLEPLPVQYADYAYWEREWLEGEVLEEQLDYWRQQLDGVTVLELPADYVRPRVQCNEGAFASFHLDQELSRGLMALSRRLEATLFMTLLAAWQTLLYRYSGQQDIVVGSPIANRQGAETEGLLGFFVNTLALRTNMSGNPTFAELVERVREMALGAYAHQALPLKS